MFPTIRKQDVYLPVFLALPPRTARAKPSPPFVHFRRSIERQPAVHTCINGWFVTAARMFQRAEAQKAVRYCCLMLSVVASKESPPSRSLCGPSLFAPSPKTPPLPPLRLPLPTARAKSSHPHTSEKASNDDPLPI